MTSRAAVSPPQPAAPPPALRDFGDWLSPIIVKELRQGLRTWVFAGALIVLQALLVTAQLIMISSHSAYESTELFWMMIAGVLVFLVPLRGFNALAGEMKADTLDMLFLTRLGALGVAVGKWAALVAQATLIALTVLPYVVLRYFAGGVDPAVELLALLALWALSGFITALAIYVSAVPPVVLRCLLFAGVAAVAAFGTEEITSWVEHGTAAYGSGLFDFKIDSLGLTLALLGVIWAVLCYFVLEMAASAVAPPSANHATRKRLIALGLLATALGAVVAAVFSPASTTYASEDAMTWLLMLAALASYDCLTETPTTVPTVGAPFARRGPVAKIAAYFLAPGWATGLLFCGVIAGFVLAGWIFDEPSIARQFFMEADAGMDEVLQFANLALSPVSILAFALFFFRQSPRMLTPFLICLFALAAFIGLLGALLDIGFLPEIIGAVSAAAIFTPVSALAIDEFDHIDVPIRQLVGVASGLIYLAYAFTRALPHLRALRQSFRPPT